MAITVRIPTAMRALTNGAARVQVDGSSTLGAVIERLDREHPGLRDRLLDETGDFRSGVNVFVNGEDVRFLHGVSTRLGPDDEVSIVPAAGGGSRASGVGSRESATERADILGCA